MIFAAIFLIGVGLLMIFKPAIFWNITEKWKSADATEPSLLYIWSIRFGGILCSLGGIASAIISVLSNSNS